MTHPTPFHSSITHRPYQSSGKRNGSAAADLDPQSLSHLLHSSPTDPQICRGGRPVDLWGGGGGAVGAASVSSPQPGDIEVSYSSEHVRQPWADVVIFPATGDFLKFILPESHPESQTWCGKRGRLQSLVKEAAYRAL